MDLGSVALISGLGASSAAWERSSKASALVNSLGASREPAGRQAAGRLQAGWRQLGGRAYAFCSLEVLGEQVQQAGLRGGSWGALANQSLIPG